MSQAELCGNHIPHVKVTCDGSQLHVRPWIMAETDVPCPRTEGGERDMFWVWDLFAFWIYIHVGRQ